MNITHRHDWHISPTQAVALQREMAAEVVYNRPIDLSAVRLVAGVDVSVKPDAAGAKALAAKCLDRGLLILTCGVYSDTVRLLTPLTASDALLKEGLDIIESAILGN